MSPETISSRSRQTIAMFSKSRHHSFKIGGALIVVWLLVAAFSTPRDSFLFRTSSPASIASGLNQDYVVSLLRDSAYVHLLMPATRPSAEFCQSIFSAAALDYPTPRILDWQKENASSQIEGIHAFLERVGPKEELMIITDPTNARFQLRPSVLLDRFFALNARANDELHRRFSKEAGISQRLVFAAQKHCTHGRHGNTETECYIPKTARDRGHDQSFLHSGTIIGFARDLLPLFSRALERVREPAEIGDDLNIFSSLFGEQEYQRERLEHEPWERQQAGSWELGIGLDYDAEISAPDGSSAMQWTTHEQIGISLPEDIQRSTPPFWTADYTGKTEVPPETWAQTRLHMYSGSGITPGITWHQLEETIPDTVSPNSSWANMFFLPYLRSLLVTKANAYRMPVAVTVSGDEKTLKDWWGPIDERGGMRIENGRWPGDWLKWDEVCGSGEISQQVFEDGLGPWVNPINYLAWDEHKEELFQQWKDMYYNGKSPT